MSALAQFTGAPIEAYAKARFQKESAPHAAAPAAPQPRSGYTFDQLKKVLSKHCDPSKGEDYWWRVLRALHHETGGSPEGLTLAIEWSAGGGEKYTGPEAIIDRWNSPSWKDPSSPSITMATLRQEGAWTESTPEDLLGDVSSHGDDDETESTAIYTAPKVTLTRGDQIEPTRIDWLWRNWIARGKIHIQAGRPGGGKSTLALSIASILSVAGKWPDGTQAPVGDIAIWSNEDSASDTLLPRYTAMGGDRRRLHFVSGVYQDGEKRLFDPAKDMPGLEEAAAQVGNISLIIIDPLVSAIAGDNHKNNEVRRGLAPLEALAEKINAAVIGICHFSKGTAGKDTLERFNGSVAFGAVSRIAFAVSKIQYSADRIFVRAKSNIGPDGDGYKYQIEQRPVPNYPELTEGASVIVWGDALTGTPEELLQQAESPTDQEPKEMAKEIIPNLMSQNRGKMTRQALFAACKSVGVGRDAAYNVIRQLKLVPTKPFGARGEVVYEMPGVSTTPVEELFDVEEPTSQTAENIDAVPEPAPVSAPRDNSDLL